MALGEPRYDDDGWEEKLALAREEHVPVVSFTFGCPRRHGGRAAPGGRVRGVGDGHDARPRRSPRRTRGADALVVQGVEAGGHRGSSDAAAPGDVGLLALLQLVRAVTDRPLVATGGIATGRGVAAVLAAGASAAQLGTAFMLTPEAGDVGGAPRGVQRRRAHGAHARVHRPLRARDREPLHARARARGAARLPRGAQPHRAAARRGARARRRGRASTCGPARPTRWREAVPAGELVRRLADEAREALGSAGRALAHRPEGRRQDP